MADTPVKLPVVHWKPDQRLRMLIGGSAGVMVGELNNFLEEMIPNFQRPPDDVLFDWWAKTNLDEYIEQFITEFSQTGAVINLDTKEAGDAAI